MRLFHHGLVWRTGSRICLSALSSVAKPTEWTTNMVMDSCELDPLPPALDVLTYQDTLVALARDDTLSSSQTLNHQVSQGHSSSQPCDTQENQIMSTENLKNDYQLPHTGQSGRSKLDYDYDSTILSGSNLAPAAAPAQNAGDSSQLFQGYPSQTSCARKIPFPPAGHFNPEPYFQSSFTQYHPHDMDTIYQSMSRNHPMISHVDYIYNQNQFDHPDFSPNHKPIQYADQAPPAHQENKMPRPYTPSNQLTSSQDSDSAPGGFSMKKLVQKMDDGHQIHADGQSEDNKVDSAYGWHDLARLDPACEMKPSQNTIHHSESSQEYPIPISYSPKNLITPTSKIKNDCHICDKLQVESSRLESEYKGHNPMNPGIHPTQTNLIPSSGPFKAAQYTPKISKQDSTPCRHSSELLVVEGHPRNSQLDSVYQRHPPNHPYLAPKPTPSVDDKLALTDVAHADLSDEIWKPANPPKIDKKAFSEFTDMLVKNLDDFHSKHHMSTVGYATPLEFLDENLLIRYVPNEYPLLDTPKSKGFIRLRQSKGPAVLEMIDVKRRMRKLLPWMWHFHAALHEHAEGQDIREAQVKLSKWLWQVFNHPHDSLPVIGETEYSKFKDKLFGPSQLLLIDFITKRNKDQLPYYVVIQLLYHWYKGKKLSSGLTFSNLKRFQSMMSKAVRSYHIKHKLKSFFPSSRGIRKRIKLEATS